MLSISDAVVARPPVKGEVGFRLTIPHLAVNAGERIGLIGPSGSGKSTVLELIALLLWPTSVERFTIMDHDAVSLLRKRDRDGLTRIRGGSIAYAPQNGGLLPYLSVFENARLAARLAGKTNRDAEISEHAERLGIQHLLQKKPASLSGGERHRASLLRMSAVGAPLIMADEPTAALDRKTAIGVIEQLTETAAASNASLICASHDVPLLEEYGFEILAVDVQEDADRVERRAKLTERSSIGASS